MSTKMIIAVNAILVASVIGLVGVPAYQYLSSREEAKERVAEESKSKVVSGRRVDVELVEIEGHKYAVAYRGASASIAHLESCQCKTPSK